jgi:hypothetical protein
VAGGGLEFLGNASGCSKGRAFEEMSNKSALTVSGQLSGGIAVDLYLRLFWSNEVGFAL